MKTIFCVPLIFLSLQVLCQNDLSKMDWANLGKYANENQKLNPPLKGEHRVVFMGNSITELWKYTDSNFFAHHAYINRGIGGQTTSQMLVRFRPDVIALKPAVVVLLAGINDIAQNTGPITLNAILGNIISMVQLAQAHGIKVILSSILPAYDFPWRTGLQPAEKIIQLNAMIQSYCIQNHIIYIDYYSQMVDERKGMDKRFSEDGVHPNLAGYKVMELLVEKAIRLALRGR